LEGMNTLKMIKHTPLILQRKWITPKEIVKFYPNKDIPEYLKELAEWREIKPNIDIVVK